MKTKMLVLPLVVMAIGCRDRYEGQAGATSSPGASASPYAEGSYASPGTTGGSMGSDSVSAVVVSVDSSGRTVTLRESSMAGTGSAGASGSEGRRFNVSDSASASLANLRPGTAVTVMCDMAGGASGTMGSGTTGTGTTGTGTTGTGTTGTGTTGTGAGGMGSGGMGAGSLANCTTITSITEAGGATGR